MSKVVFSGLLIMKSRKAPSPEEPPEAKTGTARTVPPPDRTEPNRGLPDVSVATLQSLASVGCHLQACTSLLWLPSKEGPNESSLQKRMNLPLQSLAVKKGCKIWAVKSF